MLYRYSEERSKLFYLSRRFLAITLCVVVLVLLAGPYIAAQSPIITIHEPADGATVESQQIPLIASITVLEGTSLEHYEVRVNGAPELSQNRGVDPVGEINLDIHLQPGENLIVIVAVDSLDQRTEKGITVTYKPSPVQRGDLYILAIGISDYEHYEPCSDDRRPIAGLCDLKYAHSDAQSIVEIFKNQENRLSDRVWSRELVNQKATRDSIADGLDWLLREVTQHDVAILFISGHGEFHKWRKSYYFLPHEADLDHLTTTSVPWFEFETVLRELPGLTVFFVDTCYAGSITGEKSQEVNPAVIKDLVHSRLSQPTIKRDLGV